MAESTPLSDTTPSLGLGQLSAAEWDRMLEYIDRFEAAWEAGDAVQLAAFLPPTGDPLRPVVLDELIKADLEMRWRRKEAPKLEDYVRDHAELVSPSALSSRLIFEEYRVRKQHGDRPALTSYQARFPRQYEELCRLAGATPLLATDRLSAPRPPAQPFLSATSHPGGLTFGEGYKPVQRIGSGGFGEVWRADAPGGVGVAIKIIVRPVDHAEAQRERDALELVKGLRHPFLLQTHAFSVLDDRLLIVMELADGSLRDRLKECRAQGLPGIPQEELLLYFREAAEALDFLHEKGIQHRDIKPDNILLLSGHAKMADFGLARLLESRMGSSAGAGTPPYMAPECWDGKVHEHSDQYSLAITYAELRLLRRPFAARELRELMLAHLEQTPDLGDLPGPEQAVLLKALAKEATARFGSCVEFAQALREVWLAELKRTGDSERRKGGTYGSVLPRPAKSTKTFALELAPTATTPERPRRTFPWLIVGAAAALILLTGVALTVVLMQPGKVKPDQAVDQNPPVSLPPGYQAAEDAAVVAGQDGAASLYSRIASKSDPSLVFILIPRSKPSDPQTFYISQGKISFDQYAMHAEPSYRLPLLTSTRVPVFRVSVDDAASYAESIGGYLPTTLQWDKAAGRFEEPRLPGPFLTPWQSGHIAVARSEWGPLPSGDGRSDRSPFGCWDMAGNGREWTRNLEFDAQNRLIPLKQPTKNDRVELRGQSFRRRSPFKFEDPPEGEFYLDQEDPAGQKRFAADDLGFRVVIELGGLR